MTGAHGFALAKAIAEPGSVESWWEDPNDAADAGRPRRRCHRITGAGATVLARAHAGAPKPGQRAANQTKPGFAT